MANVNLILPPSARNTRSARSFKRFIGQHGKASNLDEATGELFLFEGDQATIDAQLITYTADQVNIDLAYDTDISDAETARVKNTFDDKERRLLRAFAEVVLDELNNLRAQHGLAARTMAQLRTAIRNKL